MKIKKILPFYLFVLLLLLFFSGCATEPALNNDEEIYDLVGYWKSSHGDGFEVIDGNPKMFYQYDNVDKNISFAGEIVNSSDLDNSDGFITIKITIAGSWGKTVDEYYLTRWKDFAVNTIKESCAYKTGGDSTRATLVEAEMEFTIANGYFSLYAKYEKQ